MLLKMKLIIFEIFTLLSFNICFSFAQSQNEECEYSSHGYDHLNVFQKQAEKTNTSKNLKLSPVIEFQKFHPVFINLLLSAIISESFSNKCVDDFNYVQESLSSPVCWSMKMLDSYGKPGSGILDGNLMWPGKYDECVGIQAPSMKNTNVGGFQGRYCKLQLPLKLGPESRPITIGVCLPDSCNSNKTNFNLRRKYGLNESSLDMEKVLESEFSNVTLTCKATSRKLTVGALVVICIISVISLLAVVGSFLTVFEYYMEKKFVPHKYQNCKRVFNCFCIFTNGEKILNTAVSEGQLPCLHGIRVLSLNWIILVHSYELMFPFVANTADASNFGRWSLVLNSNISVDSFFVLSGFLVGYSFFQKALKTDGKFSWIHFYIHRYIRLTSAYMIVLAFFATIYPLLGSGPFWPDYNVEPSCKDSWWWNILYFNNFKSSKDQCMEWTWYLACDMQFYAISPLFLITLWRWPKVGYALLGLFLCATSACNFALTYETFVPDLGPTKGFMQYQDIKYRMPNYGDMIYNKPYTRLGPYLVGLFLADIVCRRKRSNYPSLKWQTLSIGWIAASGILMTCKFCFYSKDFTTIGASFFNALYRTGFALGVGWVIFVCVIGQGGVVNSILSWRALIPLSRLSYCTYLIHVIVIHMYFNSREALIVYDAFNQVILYLAFLVISYGVALVTSLLFELPVMRLETLLRSKSTPRKVVDMSLNNK